MRSTKNSGVNLAISDNHHQASGDNNPYAYPYFHSDGTSPLLYDFVVKFGGTWKEMGTVDAPDLQELEYLAKRIKARCSTQPLEVAWVDSCGDTALHRLCQVARFPSSSAPLILSKASVLVDVARALIEANPYSATTDGNNWKETPLHQFVSHCGFPNDLVEVADEANLALLLQMHNPMLDLLRLLSQNDACSLSNCWGSLPLHDACELSGWEMTSQASDHANATEKWLKQQHAIMVQYLVTSHVDAVIATDKSGQTPLFRALSSLKGHSKVLETLLSRMPSFDDDDARKVWEFNRMLQPGRHNANADEAWDVSLLLLRHYSKDDPVFRAVHAAASMPGCPGSVLYVASSRNTDQLMEPDEQGYIPLALAMNKGPNPAVEQLLSLEPRAAGITDRQGRLPLHTAIEAGYHSHDPTFRLLFKAEPHAAFTRDPVTGLFPFALAARDKQKELQTGTDSEETFWLSTIFDLLQADPSLLG